MIFPCKAYFDVEGSIEKFVTLYDLIGVINCNFCFGFLNYKLIVFGSIIKSPKRGFAVLFFIYDLSNPVSLNNCFCFEVYLLIKVLFWTVKLEN